MSTTKRGGPLEGVRVVELTKVWAGPYAGRQLGYLGAEVIKIESLESLDVTRIYGVKDMNQAPGFQAVNPQKMSVQINVKDKEGIKLALDLIAKSDIFIENLRPGAIDRMGLGYEAAKAVNPGIIFVSMGMFGNDGPLAYQTGYAPCFVAIGGLSALVGYEGEAPAGMNVRYSDSTFGTAAAYAAAVALANRRRTGKGQFIDVSAVETMSSMVGDAIMAHSLTGAIWGCDGNRHPEMAPHNLYPCQDGEWLAIAASNDAVWAEIAAAMGKPDLAEDARFKTLADRKANEVELDRLIGEWTAKGEALELASALQARGVPAGKSQTSVDLVSDGLLWGRGFYPEATDGVGNSKSIIGPSWKMTRGTQIEQGAPRLGEHNDYVLDELLGLSTDERERLTKSGAIR